MKNSKASELGSQLNATIKKQRIRAPEEHGDALVIPPYSSIGEFWTLNRKTLTDHQFQVAEQPIDRLRSTARNELIQTAQNYTRQYRDVVECNPDAIMMSGHQPRLFHPGVWYKNFALSALGHRFDATAINLVVDNDLCGLSTVSVPRIMGETEASTVSIAYDTPGNNLPFESRTINDRATFDAFGRNLTKAIAPTVAEPLVGRVWPHSEQYVDSQNRLGHSLAAARHRLEGELGLNTLEIPLSQVCQSSAFAAFVSEILIRLDEFRSIYNDSISAYRAVHNIRSVAHPVPELESNGDWTETPFWIWTAEQPVRSAMYVRNSADKLMVSNLRSVEWKFDLQNLEEQIFEAGQRQVCIRPRALMTTMYSRMVLSDLFIHGIGGSKYDQLTDAIIARFWECTPPIFITATATFKLPFDFQRVTTAEVTQDSVRLREFQYQPERFIQNHDKTIASIIEKKRELISQDVVGSGKSRRNAIAKCNDQLQRLLEAQRAHTLQAREAKRSMLAKSRVLDSRGYSFCLFGNELVEQLRALAE